MAVFKSSGYTDLKLKIIAKGLSQVQVAKLMGVSGTCLNQKLNGKREFSVNEAKKLSEILGLEKPWEYFFSAPGGIRGRERY